MRTHAGASRRCTPGGRLFSPRQLVAAVSRILAKCGKRQARRAPTPPATAGASRGANPPWRTGRRRASLDPHVDEAIGSRGDDFAAMGLLPLRGGFAAAVAGCGSPADVALGVMSPWGEMCQAETWRDRLGGVALTGRIDPSSRRGSYEVEWFPGWRSSVISWGEGGITSGCITGAATSAARRARPGPGAQSGGVTVSRRRRELVLWELLSAGPDRPDVLIRRTRDRRRRGPSHTHPVQGPEPFRYRPGRRHSRHGNRRRWRWVRRGRTTGDIHPVAPRRVDPGVAQVPAAAQVPAVEVPAAAQVPAVELPVELPVEL